MEIDETVSIKALFVSEHMIFFSVF